VCLGCHWGVMPEQPEPPPSNPVIDITTAGIQPNHACCGALVVLRGEFFGDEPGAGYRVQVQRNRMGAWGDMPVYLWTDTLIKFGVPCWTLTPGNYWVSVMTPQGRSNLVVFTLETPESSLAVSSDSAVRSLELKGFELDGGCFIATGGFGH
jgi:hypothetical protein